MVIVVYNNNDMINVIVAYNNMTAAKMIIICLWK